MWEGLELSAGTRIADRYVVLGDIGAGGMGVVLRARDERLGRLVALKVLPAAAIGDDASRKRLVREARAVAALDHPNIVHVYDVGETSDGGAFLVMELVKGKSLGDHLREGTLSRTQRLHALVLVARALHYAHEQGFLHRDIKPDNVMVREDGRVVVLDFGLAKVVAPGLGTTVEASLISSKSAFVGTPAYVSPEQARGDTLDARTDQFSLAVSMFEMVTGDLPWEGGTPLEVISHILRGEPKKLRAALPEASEELEHVFDRALKKSPPERFESCAALADAIEAASPDLSHAPSLREIGTGPKQSTRAANVQTLSAAPATSQRVAVKKKPNVALIAIASVVVVAAIGTAAFFELRHPAPAPVVASVNAKSVVACPMLTVSDPEWKQTGWLGASAGTLVCGHVQAYLGGDPDRTLIPAELLDLPRQPREGFPAEPFEAEDARKKIDESAKKADFVVTGSLDHHSDFHVMLDLQSKAGDAIAHGDAHAPTLVMAVRAAMKPLMASFDSGVDPAYVDRWFAGTSSDARIDLFDLHVVILAEDPEDERAMCDAIAARHDVGSLAPLAAALCATKLFTPLPEAPPFDPTTPGSALATASTLRFTPSKSDADHKAQLDRAAKLEELATHETDASARALLLAAASEIEYQTGDIHASALAARQSIQASPKIADVRGNAWHRGSFVSEVDNVAVLAGHAAWVPWEPYAWANLMRSLDRRSTLGYQKGYVLAQHGYWAIEYGVRLLEVDRLVEARGVAAATHNDRLDILLLHVERRPGAALDKAMQTLRATVPKRETGNSATRIAATIVDLGAFLGKPVDDAIADYVERFVMPETPALSQGVTTLFGVLAVCTQTKSPAADRCIDRIATLFDHGYFGAAILSARDAIEGARHYIKSDWAGAAKAWRTGAAELLAEALRNPMAMALDRAGEMDLADRVDDPPVASNLTAPDAELAYVRKALRAEKRGDLETAHKLARIFVDRWDTADERPPMVAEMKRVLAKTK